MTTYNDIKTIINEMSENWGEAGEAVVECAFAEHKKISMAKFLDHCTVCGGNWGGMLLSGLNELYPKTYEAIPDDMGVFAWAMICNTLILCGVESEDK